MKKDVEFYEKIIDITDTNLKVELILIKFKEWI